MVVSLINLSSNLFLNQRYKAEDFFKLLIKKIDNELCIDKVVVFLDLDLANLFKEDYYCSSKKIEFIITGDKINIENIYEEFILKSCRDHDIVLKINPKIVFLKNQTILEILNYFIDNDYDLVTTGVNISNSIWKLNEETKVYDEISKNTTLKFLIENKMVEVFKFNYFVNKQNLKFTKKGLFKIQSEDNFQIFEHNNLNSFATTPSSLQQNKNVKLFLSDVDGTLTDAGMYYSELGDELKKFSTYDGKGFELLRNAGIKTGIITSENTVIVKKRAKKLKLDYVFQGVEHLGKLKCAIEICKELNIGLDQVAYIGDDINCKELLENVGYSACPYNSMEEIKGIKKIIKLNKSGGNGAVREFIDLILKDYSC
jgi:N-acylneuraminate cytidylyltransferase